VLTLLRDTQAAARREHGYFLMEMVVVLFCAMFVVGGLLTIIEVALRQTSRTMTRVDATQRARTTVESIWGELHSACTSDGAAPIQTGSSDKSLIFQAQFGSFTNPTPVQHQITFDPIGGTLTDTTSSGTRTLLTNVSQHGSNPVFRYYAFQEPMNGGQPYTDQAGNPYMMLLDGTSPVPSTSIIPAAQPLNTPLSSNGAQTAAEVTVDLAVGGGGGTPEQTNVVGTPVEVKDSTVLRLTPAANHAGANTSFGPCE
jgi:hypothetical protein